MFGVSDKGGIGETRYPDLDIDNHKKILLENKNRLINIQNNEICLQ
jgi:hypothetical protein